MKFLLSLAFPLVSFNLVSAIPFPCANDEISFQFQFRTDDKGVESSWTLTDNWDLYNQGPLYNVQLGTLIDDETYETAACIPKSCYTLKVLDDGGNGLNFGGTNPGYILTVDNVQLFNYVNANGVNFGTGVDLSIGNPNGNDCSSNSPSLSPSESQFPSTVPSASPSQVPSKEPSQVPSKVPSKEPSQVPSKVPSKEPSQVPSKEPSQVPSKVPSASPSQVPSKEPSMAPSKVPSASPSQVPSKVPSASPSRVPSAAPSLSPSKVPTPSPSQNPSVSQFPSKGPTTSPSQFPSVSQFPSAVPSLSQNPTWGGPSPIYNRPTPVKTPSAAPIMVTVAAPIMVPVAAPVAGVTATKGPKATKKGKSPSGFKGSKLTASKAAKRHLQ